jgi:hypothetical protein
MENLINTTLIHRKIYDPDLLYLVDKDKLDDDNELSYLEIQYCNNQNGYLSNKLSLKDIINHIEGIEWLSKYLLQ